MTHLARHGLSDAVPHVGDSWVSCWPVLGSSLFQLTLQVLRLQLSTVSSLLQLQLVNLAGQAAALLHSQCFCSKRGQVCWQTTAWSQLILDPALIVL